MNILASLLVLAALAATISGKAVPESVALITKGLHQECVKETKIAEDVIEKAKAGDFSEERELKCYFKCLLARLNLISKDGVIDYETFVSMIPPDMLEIGTKMINDCRDTTGADNCEIAYNFNKCLYKSNPAEYFTV